MIHILMSSDDNYIEQTIVCMNSLFRHNEHCTVWFIHAHVSKENLRLLQSFAAENQQELKLIHIEEADGREIKGKADGRDFPPEAGYRLFCPDYLPQELDRILWLDSDIIVQGNLDSFYHMSFDQGMAFAGYEDASGKKWQERLHIPPVYRYINSGVLLINLQSYRFLYKRQMIVDYWESHRKELLYPDQDLLNVLFLSNIQYVPSEKYNLMVCILSDQKKFSAQKVREACIVHYAWGGPKGRLRPWNKTFCGEQMIWDVYYPYVDPRYCKTIAAVMKHTKCWYPVNRTKRVLKDWILKMVPYSFLEKVIFPIITKERKTK